MHNAQLCERLLQFALIKIRMITFCGLCSNLCFSRFYFLAFSYLFIFLLHKTFIFVLFCFSFHLLCSCFSSIFPSDMHPTFCFSFVIFVYYTANEEIFLGCKKPRRSGVLKVLNSVLRLENSFLGCFC